MSKRSCGKQPERTAFPGGSFNSMAAVLQSVSKLCCWISSSTRSLWHTCLSSTFCLVSSVSRHGKSSMER